MVEPKFVGERLREARKNTRKTLKQVCAEVRALGVPLHAPTLSRIERGLSGDRPSVERLIALSEVLGVPIAALVAGPEDSALVEAVSTPGAARDLIVAYLEGGVPAVIHWTATQFGQ